MGFAFVQKHVVGLSSLALAACLFAGNALAQSATTGAPAAEAPVLTPGAPANSPAGGMAGPWMNFILLGGMILFMWLFIMRPQAKRQKEHKAFLDSLRAGQEIITTGGLIGKVTSVSDTIVTVDLGSSTVRVLKSAVSGELNRAPATAAAVSAT